MITIIFDKDNGISIPDGKVVEFANSVLEKDESTIIISQQLILDAIRAMIFQRSYNVDNIKLEVHDNGVITTVKINSDCSLENWKPFPEIQSKMLYILCGGK
ncbi:hypothetical protein [Yersinia phage fHe-Yen9-03]|uniref:Uncharacterized protein n=1 Tax=Yersinia phage fHe-Yen9-03 TaxID=2052743 RepID=A0A2C9CZ90_9CAUD|nr:hypothetical protein [Yersinia phage fHe-Yen9-03]